ncbi:unnamed protein product [Closterium sp. NIES-53]
MGVGGGAGGMGGMGGVGVGAGMGVGTGVGGKGFGTGRASLISARSMVRRSVVVGGGGPEASLGAGGGMGAGRAAGGAKSLVEEDRLDVVYRHGSDTAAACTCFGTKEADGHSHWVVSLFHGHVFCAHCLGVLLSRPLALGGLPLPRSRLLLVSHHLPPLPHLPLSRPLPIAHYSPSTSPAPLNPLSPPPPNHYSPTHSLRVILLLLFLLLLLLLLPPPSARLLLSHLLPLRGANAFVGGWYYHGRSSTRLVKLHCVAGASCTACRASVWGVSIEHKHAFCLQCKATPTKPAIIAKLFVEALCQPNKTAWRACHSPQTFFPFPLATTSSALLSRHLSPLLSPLSPLLSPISTSPLPTPLPSLLHPCQHRARVSGAASLLHGQPSVSHPSLLPSPPTLPHLPLLPPPHYPGLPFSPPCLQRVSLELSFYYVGIQQHPPSPFFVPLPIPHPPSPLLPHSPPPARLPGAVFLLRGQPRKRVCDYMGVTVFVRHLKSLHPSPTPHPPGQLPLCL